MDSPFYPREKSTAVTAALEWVWALASAVAHQYLHPRIVPVPGDMMAGSTMGWFIGGYVYGKRHNRDLDWKRSAVRSFLHQVHLDAEIR